MKEITTQEDELEAQPTNHNISQENSGLYSQITTTEDEPEVHPTTNLQESNPTDHLHKQE